MSKSIESLLFFLSFFDGIFCSSFHAFISLRWAVPSCFCWFSTFSFLSVLFSYSKCIYKYRIGWIKNFSNIRSRKRNTIFFWLLFVAIFEPSESLCRLYIFVSRMSCFCYDPSIDRTQRRIEKHRIEHFLFFAFLISFRCRIEQIKLKLKTKSGVTPDV